MAKHSESFGSRLEVACVHNRGVSSTQGSGLEGCLQLRGLD